MSGWLTRLRARLGRRRRQRDLAAGVSGEWAALTERAVSDMEARMRALTPMADIVGRVSAALLRADPIGIAADADPDEYDSEAETIVMRLADRRRPASVGEVHEIVHEEFVRWFGNELAGPRDRYEVVAFEVHRLWADYLAEG
jgi:hypothetical protein